MKALVRVIMMMLVVAAIAFNGFAQSAGDYRSKTSGNWNSTATWETFDGVDWIDASSTPTSADGAITIRNSHVVTITATVTYDQVTVDAGGQVTVNSAVTHTLANGAGTDLTINGTWLNSGSTWTVTGTTWTVGAGGTYIHNTTSSVATPLGLATLDAESNFIYRGSSSLNPAISVSGRTYGNLSFESSSGAWTNGVATGTTACTINGNLSIGGSGAGTVTNALAYTGNWNVTGNVTIVSGSTFTVTTNGISLGGNWTNNGTFNRGTGTVTFNGNNALQTISGSSTTTFKRITVNKGSSRDNIVEPLVVMAMDSTLTLTNGTFKLSTASTLTPSTIATIQANGGLWINNSDATVSNGSNSLIVNGLVKISSGTFNIGNTTDNNLSCNDGSSIEIEGGTVNLAGRFTRSASPSGSFIQSGGTFTVATQGTTSSSNGAFYFDGTGSSFTMSGGTLIVQRRTPATSDCYINPSAADVTGGTIQLGNGNTSETDTIRIKGPGPIWNLVVDGTTNLKAGEVVGSDLTVNGTITLNGKNFLTGTNTINLGSSASITGEQAGRYVVGNLATTRAVGTGSSTFGGIGVELASGTDDLGNVTVTRISGSNGIVTVNDNTGIARKWSFTSDNPPTSGRDITFTWVSSDDNGKAFSSSNKAQMLRYNGSSWDQYGSAVDVSGSDPRSVTISTTQFSDWTATDENAPLPVELVSFSANVSGKNVVLKWSTATEVNNYGFEIQRAMMNDELGMKIWSKAGFVEGNGTINTAKEYSFTDNPNANGRYEYRLKQIDRDGKFTYSNVVEAAVNEIPTRFGLLQNYPNPFNPSTVISYQIPVNSMVTLKVYDAIGREVATLVNETKEAGSHEVQFNASHLSSGIYFYQLRSNTFSELKKMVILK